MPHAAINFYYDYECLHLICLCGTLFFKDMSAGAAKPVSNTLSQQLATRPISPLYVVIAVIIRVTVGDPA